MWEREDGRTLLYTQLWVGTGKTCTSGTFHFDEYKNKLSEPQFLLIEYLLRHKSDIRGDPGAACIHGYKSNTKNLKVTLRPLSSVQYVQRRTESRHEGGGKQMPVCFPQPWQSIIIRGVWNISKVPILSYCWGPRASHCEACQVWRTLRPLRPTNHVNAQEKHSFISICFYESYWNKSIWHLKQTKNLTMVVLYLTVS